jgi:hypothetical protein
MITKRKKVKVLQSDKDATRWILSIKREHLILLAVFLLAIFVRIQIDPNIPYHYDPGKNIVYARAALQSFPLVPQYNPYFNLGEYYEYQVLFPYTVAFLFIISGLSLVEITKWLVIIIGASLCLTVYYLSLEIFNNKTAALISAFLIAVSKIQLLAYMNYYPQIMAMTLMPLSFVFLVRCIKSENMRDLVIVAVLSSLIVLASYITAFVYFLIVCICLGLWGIHDKKSLKNLFFIPIITGALLTFFWLPIAWRHGTMKFIDTAQSDILTATSSAFTNQPWTFMSYLSYSNITIITIILGVITIFLIRQIKWDFQKLLLGVWLIISFLLMESYLFRPILWVDRYSQFLDMALLILTGSLFSLFIDKLNNLKKIKFHFIGYFLLLFLIFPLYGAIHVDTIYGKWGYPSDIAALEYMQGLPSGSLVVTPSGVQSFWVSALSGVNVLGGESSQMLNLRYLGNGDSDLIINSPDVNQKMVLIRKYGVNYIFLPNHKPVYMMWNPGLERPGIDAFNNPVYFEVKKNFTDHYGSTVVLKVRENLIPNYNIKKIDWDITFVGYLVSIFSFIGCVYMCTSKKILLGGTVKKSF